MANKCQYKGCTRNSIGEFCMQHKPRKAIPKMSPKTVKRIKEEGPKDTSKRDQFFLSIWKKRPHKSEISGTPLYGDISSLYFHHILEKELYKDAEFDPENIVLVTWEEHDNLHKDSSRYEEVNERRTKLLEKYE